MTPTVIVFVKRPKVLLQGCPVHVLLACQCIAFVRGAWRDTKSVDQSTPTSLFLELLPRLLEQPQVLHHHILVRS